MMSAIQTPIPARHKNVNRAEVCDQNFVEFVQNWHGTPQRAPRADEPVLPGSLCSARDFLELFESQLIVAPPRPDGARAARARTRCSTRSARPATKATRWSRG